MAKPGIHCTRLQAHRFRRSVLAGLLLTVVIWVFVAFSRTRQGATSANITINDLTAQLTDKSMVLDWSAGMAVIAGLGALAVGLEFAETKPALNPAAASVAHSHNRSRANLMALLATLLSTIGFAVILGSIISGTSWLESGAVAVLAVVSCWVATFISSHRPAEDTALDWEIDRRYLRARLLRQTRVEQAFSWHAAPCRVWVWHIVAVAVVATVAVAPAWVFLAIRTLEGNAFPLSALLLFPFAAGATVLAGLLAFGLMVALLDRDLGFVLIGLIGLLLWLGSTAILVLAAFEMQDSALLSGGYMSLGWLLFCPLVVALWTTFARPARFRIIPGSGLVRWHVAGSVRRKRERIGRLLVAGQTTQRRKSTAWGAAYRALTGVSLR